MHSARTHCRVWFYSFILLACARLSQFMAFIVAEGALGGRDATGLTVPFCELEKATPPSGPNLADLASAISSGSSKSNPGHMVFWADLSPHLFPWPALLGSEYDLIKSSRYPCQEIIIQSFFFLARHSTPPDNLSEQPIMTVSEALWCASHNLITQKGFG